MAWSDTSETGIDEPKIPKRDGQGLRETERGERSSHEGLTLSGAVAGLAACALGWFWTAGAQSEPLALFVPAALLAVASGVALPGAQAGMLAAAGRYSGAGSGLFSFVQLAASAIAAQLVGALQALGPTGLFGVMVGASALALIGYGIAALGRRTPADAG